MLLKKACPSASIKTMVKISNNSPFINKSILFIKTLGEFIITQYCTKNIKQANIKTRKWRNKSKNFF